MTAAQDPLTAQAAGVRDLDDLLQHRTRLGACALLATADALSFSRLRQLLDETDGNLGANLRKLEDAGYVTAAKAFVDRKPVTHYALTPTGRQRMDRHLAALRRLLTP
jgi:DNA-binding MarR family transcriptional regulator